MFFFHQLNIKVSIYCKAFLSIYYDSFEYSHIFWEAMLQTLIFPARRNNRIRWRKSTTKTTQKRQHKSNPKQILQQLFEKPKEYHSTKHVMSWEPSNEYPNKKRTRLQRNPENNQGKTTTRRLRWTLCKQTQKPKNCSNAKTQTSTTEKWFVNIPVNVVKSNIIILYYNHKWYPGLARNIKNWVTTCQDFIKHKRIITQQLRPKMISPPRSRRDNKTH